MPTNSVAGYTSLLNVTRMEDEQKIFEVVSELHLQSVLPDCLIAYNVISPFAITNPAGLTTTTILPYDNPQDAALQAHYPAEFVLSPILADEEKNAANTFSGPLMTESPISIMEEEDAYGTTLASFTGSSSSIDDNVSGYESDLTLHTQDPNDINHDPGHFVTAHLLSNIDNGDGGPPVVLASVENPPAQIPASTTETAGHTGGTSASVGAVAASGRSNSSRRRSNGRHAKNNSAKRRRNSHNSSDEDSDNEHPKKHHWKVTFDKNNDSMVSE